LGSTHFEHAPLHAVAQRMPSVQKGPPLPPSESFTPPSTGTPTSAVQKPGLFASAHDSHRPSQARSQHTPLLHWAELQSPATTHAEPLGRSG
jgi:hypothetical protein